MFERFDFAAFYSSDTAKRDEFCCKVVSSLRQYGFVRLVNHGIPPSDIDEAFEMVRKHSPILMSNAY